MDGLPKLIIVGLTNPYVIALVVPCLFMIAGAFGKKIVRGGGWKLQDLYLGVELTLSALSSALVDIFDVLKQSSANSTSTNPMIAGRLVATASFIAVTFFLFLFVLSTHQDWEQQSNRPKMQFFWLGVVSNGIGILLVASFVLAVKGVH